MVWVRAEQARLSSGVSCCSNRTKERACFGFGCRFPATPSKLVARRASGTHARISSMLANASHSNTLRLLLEDLLPQRSRSHVQIFADRGRILNRVLSRRLPCRQPFIENAHTTRKQRPSASPAPFHELRRWSCRRSGIALRPPPTARCLAFQRLYISLSQATRFACYSPTLLESLWLGKQPPEHSKRVISLATML